MIFFSVFPCSYRQLFKVGNGYLNVEMSGVAENRAVFHFLEMFLMDYFYASCNRDKDITQRSRLIHGHYCKSVHYCLYCLYRVNFVMITFAPSPRALRATPLPHHPYPATTTVFPATIRLVVLFMPSQTDWPVPYRLSNRCLHMASFTAIMGIFSTPSRSIAFNLRIPVVVSSHPPQTLGIRSCFLVCRAETRSPRHQL